MYFTWSLFVHIFNFEFIVVNMLRLNWASHFFLAKNCQMPTLPQVFNENSPCSKKEFAKLRPVWGKGPCRQKAVYWNDPVQKCCQVMRNQTEYVWGVSPASLQYKNWKKRDWIGPIFPCRDNTIPRLLSRMLGGLREVWNVMGSL
jgi:hypothetical protein